MDTTKKPFLRPVGFGKDFGYRPRRIGFPFGFFLFLTGYAFTLPSVCGKMEVVFLASLHKTGGLL